MNTAKRPAREELLPLMQIFNSFHPMGKEVEQYLLKTVYTHTIPKGEYLLRRGEVPHSIYFIKKGLLRGFIEEENKEVTIWFAMENEILGPISSFIQQSATIENSQAIEDCELLGLSFTDLEQLYKEQPSFNIIGRKLTELYFVYAENRIYMTRLNDPGKKYELFLRYYSHLLSRLNQEHIASFLDITPATLTRIQKRMEASKK